MNSLTIHRRVRLLLASGCLGVGLAFSSVGHAQEPRAAGQFGTVLQENDRQLTSIERVFGAIESNKNTEERDKLADELESRLQAYAKAMLSAFENASRQAEEANRTQGKQGSFEALKSFEDLAVKHENRLKQLDERGKKLAPPRSGFLLPLHGDFAFAWQMLEKLGNFIISPAEAAIALMTYSACHQSPPNQTACAQAIASGINQAHAAQSAFQSCWNSKEGDRPKWWRAIERGFCTTALLVRLA